MEERKWVNKGGMLGGNERRREDRVREREREGKGKGRRKKD
jgi:hypothetical protein